MRFRLFTGFFIVLGCVSDTTITPPQDSGSNDTSVAPDTGGDGSTCTPGCANPTTFRSCAGPEQTCALGCTTTPNPHCAILNPASPVTSDDLTAPLGDLVVTKFTTLHTDTGAIDGIRPANGTATSYEVKSNIGFRLEAGSNVGVFVLKNFTINDTIIAAAQGKAALAIASSDTIKLIGVLDARGYTDLGIVCGNAPSAIGPAGTQGGQSGGADGDGAGGGNGADIGGGGGGGFGGKGGDGQHNTSESSPMSVGGPMVPFAIPVAGGFGGGGNGAGVGGAGGGAVQLVAAKEISVGGGGQNGGVNVGGCSGYGGKNGSVPNTGGGGGGSGGEILLQSPLVSLLAKGVLAANGGAGGSGSGAGNPGLLSDQPAQPLAVNGTTFKGPGGPGSAGSQLNGANAGAATTTFGGGGGGGAGRIRIDNASGTITPATGAIVSPSLGSIAATAIKVATK